jgi:hypothetical protein
MGFRRSKAVRAHHTQGKTQKHETAAKTQETTKTNLEPSQSFYDHGTPGFADLNLTK